MNARFWDKLLTILKWPAALFSLFALPAAVLGLGAQIFSAFSQSMIWCWVGFAGYFVLWHTIFKRKMWGSWLPTFEHELAHAIFAWLTLHRVTDFHASWSKGGHIRYVGGKGNWLITIAPYFFPLFSLLVLGLYIFFPQLFGGYFQPIMGFVLGFQVCSTWGEIHREQVDLQQVGWPFVFCFLPTVNLLVYTWFLAVLQGETTAVVWGRFFEHFSSHVDLIYGMI